MAAQIVVSENTVKRWVKDDLAFLGLHSWPITAGSGTIHGISDRLAIGPGGIFCAFEVKGGVFRKSTGWQAKQISDHQQTFLKRVEQGRGYGLVVGPREGVRFLRILLDRFPELRTDARDKKAVRQEETRGRHLQSIVERGF